MGKKALKKNTPKIGFILLGMEEEKKYSFADHIFLEKHLTGWCPTRGPIRHFMELVCVGLSKNHHIGVPRKIAHIEWFRDFFEDKKQLLKDIGAIQELKN